MIYDVTHALFKLAPGAKWVHRGEGMDFNGIEWSDEEVVRPTNEELQAVIDELNAAEPMRLLRLERNKRIAVTDWWAMPDRTMTSDQIAYRNALRDLPVTSNPTLLANGNLDLESVTWPVYNP